MPPGRHPPGPGQESAWDYPRPPRLERVAERLRVEFDGVVIADTVRGWRVLETSHPPVYYLIQEDIRPGALLKAAGGKRLRMERASDLLRRPRADATRRAGRVGLPRPTSAFALIAGHVAFYA